MVTPHPGFLKFIGTSLGVKHLSTSKNSADKGRVLRDLSKTSMCLSSDRTSVSSSYGAVEMGVGEK